MGRTAASYQTPLYFKLKKKISKIVMLDRYVHKIFFITALTLKFLMIGKFGQDPKEKPSKEAWLTLTNKNNTGRMSFMIQTTGFLNYFYLFRILVDIENLVRVFTHLYFDIFECLS